ncbi:hypothetical protein TNIN_313391 [Trichonephila inaurata madagascariensis]|uniref:Uncharacterized protein n=1 Tax=Trichonephila inaurata madagascariensis TaxID=2747483 RepID=A0A8X7C8Q7_9ARAC|nr:hypothetical protein TNIN_313391 [Trichonephila inaurata madagascariensis]
MNIDTQRAFSHECQLRRLPLVSMAVCCRKNMEEFDMWSVICRCTWCRCMLVKPLHIKGYSFLSQYPLHHEDADMNSFGRIMALRDLYHNVVPHSYIPSWKGILHTKRDFISRLAITIAEKFSY